MLSRQAESLYWLGRYLERAENVARLADVNYNAAVEHRDDEGQTEGEAWDAVIAALGAAKDFEAARAVNPGQTPADFLILAQDNPESLTSIVTRARGLARELREHLSREVFEEINLLYLSTARGAAGDRSLRTLYASVRRAVATAVSLFDHTVLLNEGREWFRCGLFIERADMTSRIIDAKYFLLLPSPDDVGGPLDRYQWRAILRSASALEAFHKRYRGPITAARVAELLMFDAEFPRSLLFSVLALRRHYERATRLASPSQTVFTARELALLELDLRAATADVILDRGLHEFLDEFQRRLITIDTTLAEHIFRAVPEPAL